MSALPVDRSQVGFFDRLSMAFSNGTPKDFVKLVQGKEKDRVAAIASIALGADIGTAGDRVMTEILPSLDADMGTGGDKVSVPLPALAKPDSEEILAAAVETEVATPVQTRREVAIQTDTEIEKVEEQASTEPTNAALDFLWKLGKFILLPLRLLAWLVVYLWNIEEHIENAGKAAGRIGHLLGQADNMLSDLNQEEVIGVVSNLLKDVESIVGELKERGIAVDISTIVHNAAEITSKKELFENIDGILVGINKIVSAIAGVDGQPGLLNEELFETLDGMMNSVKTTLDDMVFEGPLTGVFRAWDRLKEAWIKIRRPAPPETNAHLEGLTREIQKKRASPVRV